MGTLAYLDSVRAALRTTTGTQDFTISGFGTPKGYIVRLTKATADGTITSEYCFSEGYSDGTNFRCIGEKSRNGQSSSSCHRAAMNARVGGLIKTDGSGFDVEVQHSAYITDGVRLNISTTNAVAYLCTVILIGGADAQVAVGSFDMANGSAGDTLDVTSLGFAPDWAEMMGADLAFASGSPTPTADIVWSCGFVANAASGIKQQRMSYSFTNGQATSRPSYNSVATNVHSIVTAAASSPFTKSKSVRITAILSNGFTAQNVLGGDPNEIAYIAVKMGAFPDLATSNSSTSAGGTTTFSMTRPGYALILSSIVTAVGDAALTTAGELGFGFASVSGNQHSIAVHEKDNVGTTVDGCISDDTAVNVPLEDGSAAALVASASWSDTALTLTWSTVQASARNQFILLLPRQALTLPAPLSELDVTDQALAPKLSGAQALQEDDVVPQSITPKLVAPVGLSEIDVTAQGITPKLVAPVGLSEIDLTAQALAPKLVAPVGLQELDLTAQAITPKAIAPLGLSEIDLTAQAITPKLVAPVPLSQLLIQEFGVIAGFVIGISELDIVPSTPASKASAPLGLQEAQIVPQAIQPSLRAPLPLVTLEIELFATPQVALVAPAPLSSIELSPFVPLISLGAQVLTNKKRIYDALVAAVRAAQFRLATYQTAPTEKLIEGAAVQPASLLVNESRSDFDIAKRWRRTYKLQRNDWVWEMILLFDKEVITELFERGYCDSPIILPRDVPNGLERVIVRLADLTSLHPPQQNSSNGTKATYRFVAELAPV